MKFALGDVVATPYGNSWWSGLGRVLLCDEIEFAYDALQDGVGWGFRRVPKTAGANHEAVCLASDWEILRNEPLTEKELAAYRPDLPMRLCRHPTLNWDVFSCATPDEIPEWLADRDIEFSIEGSIEAPSIALLFAPGQSLTVKAVKVKARDGGKVPIVDLLWHAQKLIADQGHEAPDGIGLFRTLRWAGSPGYFVGGYHKFSTWYHLGEDPHKLPEWTTQRKPVTGDLKARLKAAKKLYPFSSWRSGVEHGLDQYSKENCDAAKAIFDRLIEKLTMLGEQGSEATKLELFREAVEGLNDLDAEEGNLIETGEREQLCELFNEIARAVGLDPAKYGGGEGPASLWRDW